MDATDAIRVIALRDVWLRHLNKADDPDYNRRVIFQYYSEHFSTPLHVVETLPIVDVIRAYWEHVYRNMSDEDLEGAVRQASLTEAERQKHQAEDDAGEMDLDAIKAAVAAGAYGNLATAKTPLPPKPRVPGPPKPSLKEPELAPTVDIKDLDKLPQSISIKFTDDDSDLDIEGDGLGLLEIPTPRAAKP